MNIRNSDIEKLMGDGKGRRYARARPRHVSGQMNKTEQRYAKERLDMLLYAGEIVSYAFEKVKIRLADRTYFTPDFFVVTKDMAIEFHEVKGFFEDDARVKIKVAAETFPARFIAVTWKNKQWHIEEF